MNNDMTVANTILGQLGGGRFSAMTGAKHFIGGENFLQFKLPNRFAKDGINSVRITLDPSDTYTAEFHKLSSAGRRGTYSPRYDVKLLRKVSDIYADQLQDVFTMATGLVTSL